MPHVDSIDLDSRFTKDELKEKNKKRKGSTPDDGEDPTLPKRPVVDYDFKLILIGNDPNKGVKIGTGLPDITRKQLKVCFRNTRSIESLLILPK